LVIWDCKTGKEVAEFEWRKTAKEGPKSLKFSKDERFCARLSSRTQIEIYENGNFKEAKTTITANADTLSKKNPKNQQEVQKPTKN